MVGQIVGALVWGPIDRLFGSYKIAGADRCAADRGRARLAAAGRRARRRLALLVWFVAFGVSPPILPVLIAHGKSLFPPHLVGRGMTLLNIGTMGGVFLSQTVTGFVIDLFPAQDGAYPLDAYRAVFALQALLCLLRPAFAYLCGARSLAQSVTIVSSQIVGG